MLLERVGARKPVDGEQASERRRVMRGPEGFARVDQNCVRSMGDADRYRGCREW